MFRMAVSSLQWTKYVGFNLTPLFSAIALHGQLGVSHVFVGVHAAGDLFESGQRIFGAVRQVRVQRWGARHVG